MKITVNDKELEVSGKRTLIEELREAGYDIPALCYASRLPNGMPARHQPSCMVCMVRNEANDQMMPSCSTYPAEGMRIDTDSEEVRGMRRMALELLLSDHRADCEAPCSQVCPAGIDVARVILLYDRGRMAEARALLASQADIDNLPCPACKGGCEKVCRRGTVDRCVDIKGIIREVAAPPTPEGEIEDGQGAAPPTPEGEKEDGQHTHSSVTAASSLHVSPSGVGGAVAVSKLGRFTDAEKAWLKEVYTQPSHCLHCACEGRDKCKLRQFASAAGIRSSRYGVSSRQIVKEQQHVIGQLYFEPAKCVRCGLCVNNTEDGFTFQHRGFDMQVVIPEESKSHVDERIAELCPTGALFVK